MSITVEKFLQRRAVNVIVAGNYTLTNWFDQEGKPRSFACRTRRVSPFRMMVDVPVVGRFGDRITSYFGEFGPLEGRICDTVPGSFLLELTMTPAMRRKLADQLTWLENRQKDPSVRDVRLHARIVPASPHSTMTLADGTMKSCFVIDMSVSGAAVSADLQPAIGTPLAIGACIGRVVRHLPDGFAVKFVEHVNREDLEWRIIRPLPRQAAQNARVLQQVQRVAPPPGADDDMYLIDA
jgi:hypothetical protein